MHVVNIVVGAAFALPALCLGAPIKAVPNTLNLRIESMSSGSSLELGAVVKRGSVATQEVAVEIKGASDTSEEGLEVALGSVVRRDSDTDETGEPGIII